MTQIWLFITGIAIGFSLCLILSIRDAKRTREYETQLRQKNAGLSLQCLRLMGAGLEMGAEINELKDRLGVPR